MKESKFILIKLNRYHIPLYYDNINYIRYDDDICIIHLDKISIKLIIPLNQLIKLLQDKINIAKINRRIAISINAIQSFNNKEITFNNYTKLDIEDQYKKLMTLINPYIIE